MEDFSLDIEASLEEVTETNSSEESLTELDKEIIALLESIENKNDDGSDDDNSDRNDKDEESSGPDSSLENGFW